VLLSTQPVTRLVLVSAICPRARLPLKYSLLKVTIAPSALACDSSIKQWSSDKLAWDLTERTHITGIPTVSTWTTTTRWETLFNCTSTCGTVCYGDKATTIIETSTWTEVTTTSSWIYPEFPTPKPTCSIGRSDCLGMHTTYSSKLDEWADGGYEGDQPDGPECCVSTACTMGGAGVDFIFFVPSTTAERDYCIASPTGTWGQTLSTSPTLDPSMSIVLFVWVILRADLYV